MTGFIMLQWVVQDMNCFFSIPSLNKNIRKQIEATGLVEIQDILDILNSEV